MCLSQVEDEQVSSGSLFANRITGSHCFAVYKSVTGFYRFLGCDDHETYFTNTQRHRVVSYRTSSTVHWIYSVFILSNGVRVCVLFQVYEILSRTVYGKKKRAEVGVDRLINEGAYTATFPLHEVRFYSSAV